jgi:hypothetical protein
VLKQRLVWLAVLVFASLTLACGADPKRVAITEANQDKLLDEMKDMKGLTVGEARMLIAYQMRYAMAKGLGRTPPSMAGKTVGQLITEQTTFEADAKKQADEQERLAADAKAKADALAAELKKTIQLTVYDKVLDDGQFQDTIDLKVAYQNLSSKDVRAFSGKVRFADLFGAEIMTTTIKIQDPIKAGSKGEWVGSINYNQFIDQHKRLAGAEMANMKIEWIPTAIIFGDGTQVGGEVTQ